MFQTRRDVSTKGHTICHKIIFENIKVNCKTSDSLKLLSPPFVHPATSSPLFPGAKTDPAWQGRLHSRSCSFSSRSIGLSHTANPTHHQPPRARRPEKVKHHLLVTDFLFSFLFSLILHFCWFQLRALFSLLSPPQEALYEQSELDWPTDNMATYEQYPTPPPTSSPKHTSSTYHPFSPKLPAQDTYYQDTQPHSSSKLPAQDTYYKQSYSTPASPTHWDPSSHPPNDHPIATTTTSYEYLPPRRKSSPIQNSNTKPNPYYNPPSQRPSFPQNGNGRSNSGRVSPNTPNPYQRPSRTKTRTPPPRPIYFSPTNPLPSPYSLNRPTPRPGFIKRMLAKLSSWLRSLLRWAQKNPIKAGLASFLPLLAGAGLVKGAKALGLGKLLGEIGWVKGLGAAMGMVGGGIIEGMGGGKARWEEAVGKGKDAKGKIEKEVEKGAEKLEEGKEWGYGLDHFVGFGGTKKGPLDGIMKILLMGV
ncbi:uncharacterized protein PAC_06670 [Phialocephala subalpina]|uniref:Uncharacterized protein n=1 Tax=Phialocephala subalpina TaxID=576137 RepID=A0A1L7WVJ7_9HELO|nr:uncharacterized protein PAC_06670 [Phialocephala subalpina]